MQMMSAMRGFDIARSYCQVDEERVITVMGLYFKSFVEGDKTYCNIEAD